MNATITTKCLLGAALGVALFAICGCEGKAPSERSTAHAPMSPGAPRLSAEEQTKADREFTQLIGRLDMAIAKPSGVAAWVPPATIESNMQRAAADAQIEQTGCAVEFCRYRVTVKNAQSKQAFPQRLLIHGAVIFDYPADSPLTIVAYVFKPGADMRSL